MKGSAGRLVVGVAMILALGTAACEKEGPMEKAGKKIDDAAETVHDKAANAAETVRDKAKDAADEAEDVIDEAN